MACFPFCKFKEFEKEADEQTNLSEHAAPEQSLKSLFFRTEMFSLSVQSVFIEESPGL